MKIIYQLFAILLALGIGSSTAMSQTVTDALTTINNLKTAIDTQIERIQSTRESTDSQLALSRLRIGEQIRKSQEDLAVQMEALLRLKDQLEEQKTLAEQSVTNMNNNLSALSTSALSNIEAQISKTNDLLSRMEKLMQDVSGDSSSASGISQSTDMVNSSGDTGVPVTSNPQSTTYASADSGTSTSAIPESYSPLTVTVTPSTQPTSGSSSGTTPTLPAGGS